ncbi:MAG: DNA repair protein RadC [Desulfovibrionaceae bacterium]|nr:DNA repair protein RadC [Desulfovibrionaceae bacterium]
MDDSAKGHRERLRSRFLTSPSDLPDYEFLELLLGYARPRIDTKPLAKRLLSHFGSIQSFLASDDDEVLLAIPDAGPGLAVFRRILHELQARCAEEVHLNSKKSLTPESVAAAAAARLSGRLTEEFWILSLDAGCRKIAWECLSRGTADGVNVSPRAVLECLLRRKASAAVLIHNHPGGTRQPSAEDQRLTGILQSMTDQIGIELLDHLIICDGFCFSMRQGKDISFSERDKSEPVERYAETSYTEKR